MSNSTAQLAGTKDLPPELKGGVVAIGNFDGIHRGHRAVLDRALEEAHQYGCPALALTFEPHPRTFFRPQTPVFRLTPPPLKRELLAELGFDAVIEQSFDAAFAAQTAHDFVGKVLVADLGVTHVIAGHDFHFGKGREGTPDFLKAEAASRAFGVDLVEPLTDEGGDVISSSRIRALLGRGDVAGATALLGHRHAVEARVDGGQKLGRTLGFPTANMVLPPEYGLAHGIYAVRLRRADGSLHHGVASFGRRPTVEENGRALLETHLFDFDGDLYGEECTVAFFAFLRGEEKFDSLEALTEQMRHDAAEARAALSGVTPLSELDNFLSFEA
ncbi:MAG: bifunctional riboflavin kinase/FAD synthetase [Salaquimonas sp.]|nr:bifunctional riboflavin kinase/FAD synthetase [Salaquimonas sp.]